jgi:glycosyltransferase involved in cell wall biosynthesis
MNITYISSFTPRKCGISSYTRDLSNSLKETGNDISIVAMENPTLPLKYDNPVKNIIHQERIKDYKEAALKINDDTTDIVHLQHEFGLFGGEEGEHILEFANYLKKPLIVTFHTVLMKPNEKQLYITQELARLSWKITVMDEVAKDRLNTIYGLNNRDIEVILHGAPEITMEKESAKEALDLSDKFVVLANNLLSRNKGIEYAIEAISLAVNHIPNILFLIVGETHPLVKIHEGESYREELIQQVKTLHLEKNVIFNNDYVDVDELQILLSAADVYVTPYLDPQQITSGTLSYAVGVGKACIATEYIYAKDLLSNGKGMLVPFKDGPAIAKALIELYSDPKKLHSLELKTQVYREEMKWSAVGKKHSNLYKNIILLKDSKNKSREFIHAPINASYLSYLTDSVGIIQHTSHLIPDRKFGYSTDDNARALIVVSTLYKQKKMKELLKLIHHYVSFLQFAQDPSGQFHTFLKFNGSWDDKSDVTDPFARAVWALGHYLHLNENKGYIQSIEVLFVRTFKQFENIRDLRAAAYSIFGLYYYILTFQNKKDTAFLAIQHLTRLADLIVIAYEKNHSTDWQWIEDLVTYDNFRIPQALYLSYLITHDEKYKKIATNLLNFLTSCNYDNTNKQFDFIGQNGWYKKGSKKADYDQQPLEAAGAVETYLTAYQVTGKEQYYDLAWEAFEWFFGKNRNHRYLYDETTYGVFDGLNTRGVNENEGAESIICFLMAALSLKSSLKRLRTKFLGVVAKQIV